ncbi:hypothetical protein, partial [Klebsiella pneumoniae]|uniref:hypothetical protein n=1 Tax=Klebsiella pneumoniae TaxID=573 RepID=UPI00272F2E9C
KTSVKWTSVTPSTLDKLTTTEQLAPKIISWFFLACILLQIPTRIELSFCTTAFLFWVRNGLLPLLLTLGLTEPVAKIMA